MGLRDWAGERWSARHGDSAAFQAFAREQQELAQSVGEHREWLRARLRELGATRQDLKVLDQFESAVYWMTARFHGAMHDPEVAPELIRRMKNDIDLSGEPLH